MGTSLGRLNFLPLENVEVEAQKLRVLPLVVTEMTTMGLTPPRPPLDGYQGEMPSDITTLTDEELGNYLNKLSEWTNFIEYRLKEAAVSMEDERNVYEYIRARVRIEIKSNKEELGRITEGDKNDLVIAETRVRDAIFRKTYSEALHELILAIRNGSQRNWETVSRRITQRGQDVQRQSRLSNVAGVPVASRTFRRPL